MKNKIYKITKILLSILVLVLLASFFSPKLVSADHCAQQGYVHNLEGNCIQGTDWEQPDDEVSDYNPEPTESGTVDFHVLDPAEKTENLASDTVYEFLAPFSDQYKIFDVKDGSCPFGRYANMMIIIFMGIAAVLAMIMIIMGGIEYMTSELISSKEAGKEKITHAVLGLLLALGAWLILNTINPNILNLCFKVETLEFELNSPDTPQTAVKGQICSRPSYPTLTDGEPTKWDDKIANITPLPSGVNVNHPGDCTEIGDEGCTSLRGFKTSIVDKIKNKCSNCEITITGGTECWLHSTTSTHKPGSSTVDLRFSDSLDSYIEDQGKFLYNTNGTGYPVYSLHGIKYMKEGDHWHVWQ